jgi:hypothetical protein
MDPTLVHHKLNDDLEFFAEHAPLLIKDKQGRLIRWTFNLAQRYTHDRLEAQLKRYGWVRALILKGRQQGESTYVEGRGYHTTTRRRPGTSAFILSHEGSATDKLFTMLRRYHENVQTALKPELGKDNPRALTFPALGSDFAAATANNEQAGRGGTAQFFHGSEVAYWDYAYEIQDGAIQTIALLPGTEIILESTANGPVGLFYEKCQQAIRGEGDYQLIFIPWFWQEEYERDVDASFEPTGEEEAYIATNFSKPFPYHSRPISREKALRKMAWRRATIVDLSNEGGGNPEIGRAKFRTIYPANPIEAFQASGVGLFRPDAITAARASQITETVGARILGCDLAGDSDNADRTVISLRQGRRIFKRWQFSRMRPMEAAGIIGKIIDEENIDMAFIDRGYGEGTIDRLMETGYGAKVIGIAFNERPLEPDIYSNKRTEIFMLYAKWLNAGDVRIPDEDEGHAALASIPPAKPNSNGLLALPPKDVIKKGAGASVKQDIVDADALTFSYPVRVEGANTTRFRKAGASKASGGPLKSSALRGRRS